MSKQPDENWGLKEHLLTGAGVGAAGVTKSVALIGLSSAMACLPIGLVVGLAGGLVWWCVKGFRDS